MRSGYKVNETIGNGSFIEVYNWSNLNEVGQFRFYIMPKKHSSNLVGIWKQKIYQVNDAKNLTLKNK